MKFSIDNRYGFFDIDIMIKTYVPGFFDIDLHKVSWHFATHEVIRPSGF